MTALSSFEQVSFPADESLMTPEERRLRMLEAARKERSTRGKAETLAQQYEYECVLRENLISDLNDLRGILKHETAVAAPGQVCMVKALVASGHIPKEALSDHPIMIGETTRGLAMKRLASLHESNERLAMLDIAMGISDEECERLKMNRGSELCAIEAEWGLH